jgi:argininosuccinate lyase
VSNPSSEALGVGHRLTSGTSELLARTAFAHELQAAPALWHGMAMADLAHALALEDAGLLPDRAVGPLFTALLESVDGSGIVLDPQVGDIYNNRDRWLRSAAGEAAGYLHTGRARREASTIGWQLACRERLLALGLATSAFVDTLSRVALDHVETLMPDLTYLHRAQPTTLGHYLLGHAAPFGRHLQRLDDAIRSVDASPAGSGSTNGSRLPIDRQLLADLLGFSTLVRHTRDAMWAPDMVLDVNDVAFQIMLSVDRLAEELQLFTTEGFGFAELDDAESRTSVVMPHKKNPYSLTWLRGASRRALGTVTGVAATMLTSSGQPDSRTFAYLDVPVLLDETTSAVQLLERVVAGTTFDLDRLREAASTGFTTSTEICDHLSSTTDIDNRTSHQIVGAAVRRAVDAGRDELDYADLLAAASGAGVEIGLDESDFTDLVSPANAIASRVTPGGAAPDEVHRMVDEMVDAAEVWAERFRNHPSHGYDVRLIRRAEPFARTTGAAAT